MRMLRMLALGLVFCAGFYCWGSGAEVEGAKDLSDSEEYRVGVMVKEISAALQNSADPKSFELITTYGHDSRYYVMIRGWLVQELSGTQSQVRKNDDSALNRQKIQKVDFLTKAIRRIDLE